MKTKLRRIDKIINSLGRKPLHDIDAKQQVVVGVLTSLTKMGKYPLPVGKEARIKVEMTTMAKNSDIFMYFFYPEGFSKSKQTIVGHTYMQNSKKGGEWVKGVFPLPDIVYNRLSFRRDEHKKKVQELLTLLELNPNIHLFNSRFLHKWEVHNSLSKNSSSAKYVPETCRFTKLNLYKMLVKFPELFIKPINSSVGKGIIKVRCGPNHYDFKVAASDRKWHRCSSKKHLFRSLISLTTQDRFLIQEGIDLAEFNGRIFDLRTQVQKDGNGNWIFVGVGVRVAARNKFVTHVPNGGSRADYIEVTKKVFGESPSITQQLDQQLSCICQVVPYVLEKSLGINLGILSIDIGIDKTGQMKIIEVNSRPGCFDEDNIRQKHLKYLNEYFLYLSNSSNIDMRGD